ncbi:MAG: radical SAM protein [Candidatus Omnitrophota bacterium]
MRYIYGPLRSRRLGNSLGINLTDYKTCSFDCVYCQLGKSIRKTQERKEYISIEEIINELKAGIANHSFEVKDLDYITLSGSGEPVLNIKIEQAIKEIKSLTNLPIAILTNASLLKDPSVRPAVQGVDLIVPSLDAVTQEIFEKINRPCPGINIKDIINGLIDLRKEFRGKIWLEIMLVRGINDDLRHIRKLKEVIDNISPDEIHLNSPVRAAAEMEISAVTKNKIEKIKRLLGDRCRIV